MGWNILMKNRIKQIGRNALGRTILAALLLGLVFLTGCGSKAPDTQTMKNDLPDEAISVEIDSISIPLDIVSLKIEKQQINKKSSTAYCVVECKNDNYSCKKYVILNYNYYEKGGWILDSWDYFQGPECHVLTDPFTKETIISELEGKYGIDGISFTDSNFDPVSETVTYQFDAKLDYRYVSRSGPITWTATFEEDGSFFWNSVVEDSGLVSKWNITGHWSWEEPPGKQCELLIRTFDPDSMTAEGYSSFTGDYWDPDDEEWDTYEYAVSTADISEYGRDALVLSFGDTMPDEIDFTAVEGEVGGGGTYVAFFENDVIASFRHYWKNETLISMESGKTYVQESTESFDLSSIDNGTVILGNYKELEVTKNGTGEEAEQKLKNDLYEAIFNNSKVEPKQEAIEANLNNFIDIYKKQAESYDMDLAELTGMSEEKLREELRNQAKAAVEQRLIVNEIARREGIKINDNDRLKAADQMGHESVDDMIHTSGIFAVDDYILNNKVMDFVIENAIIR